jgi:hypothetical protein
LGTIITGRAGSFREARELADQLFRKDIYRIHHHKKVWGKVDPPPFIRGYDPVLDVPSAARMSPDYPYYILDYDPQYMGLDLQAEDAAGMITKLGALEFLCRPAVREGAVSQEVVPLLLADATRDPDSGQWQFPDPEQDAALIAEMQQRLAARSGIPVTDILKEQETRLPQGTLQPPRKPQPVAEVRGRQPSSLPDPAQPEPSKAKETQSRPTLAEQQRAFLAFLIEHQADTPISEVYKRLSLSWRTGNQLRDSLTKQGYIAEIELRPGKVGRPTKVFLPTFAAFALLGKDPPAGRGGAIHRHMQQMVAEDARAKGYTAKVEYQLPSGAIVDVHLERGQEKIAVEFAVLSHPSRELAHIRQCLLAGYDKVVAVFADPQLLEKTNESLAGEFSERERALIQLIPVTKLSDVR